MKSLISQFSAASYSFYILKSKSLPQDADSISATLSIRNLIFGIFSVWKLAVIRMKRHIKFVEVYYDIMRTGRI